MSCNATIQTAHALIAYFLVMQVLANAPERQGSHHISNWSLHSSKHHGFRFFSDLVSSIMPLEAASEVQGALAPQRFEVQAQRPCHIMLACLALDVQMYLASNADLQVHALRHRISTCGWQQRGSLGISPYMQSGQGHSLHMRRGRTAYAAMVAGCEAPSMYAVSSRCSAAAACATAAPLACALTAVPPLLRLPPLAAIAAGAGLGKYLARTASMHAIR